MATAFWTWGEQNMHELITLINYLNGQNEGKIRESGKILLLESRLMGFGIRNTAQEFRISLNPESKFHP